MTVQTLSKHVKSATRRRRSYFLARPDGNGDVSVRIAAVCWMNPRRRSSLLERPDGNEDVSVRIDAGCWMPPRHWIHLAVFQLLPRWQQEALLKCEPQFEQNYVSFNKLAA